MSLASLRRSVAELLGEPDCVVGDDDDLLHLGLDSIAVIRLANTWRRSGFKVTAAELFERRTIREWSELLSRRWPNPRDYRPPELIPGDDSKPFDLSTMQLAYWIGRQPDQILGGIGAHFYNEFNGCGVDPVRLESAVKALIRRHGMLRARFLDEGRQVIATASPWPGLVVHDLRESSPDQVMATTRALREQLSYRRLDVENGHVFDVQLTLLPEGKTRVHIDIDMLVADAQSFRILLSDLAAVYERPGDELPSLEISYPQYMAARRARPDPGRPEAQAYWRRRISSLPSAPSLPLAMDPQLMTTSRMMHRWHRLSASQWERLGSMAGARGVTLPVTLLTAFAEVLGAWSGQSDLLLSLPSYDREAWHPDVDRLVGDFTNLVLLAVEARPAEGFTSRARRTQSRLQEDLAHASYSGVEVLRDLMRLRPEAAGIVPVVFTSAINLGELFDSGVRRAFGDPGWTVSQTPQVWLDYQVTEREGELLLNWDALEDLFPAGVIDDMFAAYVRRVESLLDDHGWDAASEFIPLVQQEARRRVNGTAARARDVGLHADFFTQAEAYPDRVAACWEPGGSLSYGQLADEALRIAGALAGKGIQPGESVGICLPKGPDQIRAVLGILAARCAYVPISVEQPALRRSLIAERSQLRAVLAARDWATGWPDGVQVLTISAALAARALPEAGQVSGDDLAYVLSTSGSTGEPKAVELTHAAALNTVDDLADRFELGPGDVALGVSQLDFDLSVFDIFGMLTRGGTVVLVGEEQQRDPAGWARLMAGYDVTLLNCVPMALDQILLETERGGPPPVALRLVLVGGDRVGVDLPRRLAAVVPRCRFVALGGTTETAIHSTICEVDPAEAVPQHWRSIPYGVPLRNVVCRIVDSSGRDCPDWVTGELWIGGMGVARGYRGDPALTADRFVDTAGRRWYRTGDLGRYQPGGILELVGRRTDHQVKVNGRRIELGEIEACLEASAAVRSAVVTTYGTPARLGAVVQLHQPGLLDQSELRRFMAGRLPPYMLPAGIVTVLTLPLTANAKVDRAAVAALLSRGQTPEAGREAPREGLEQTVADLWTELLGVTAVRRQDSFFALGGDSLLATRLVGRLRAAGVEGARLSELFATPVLADFASALRLRALPAGQSRLHADLEHRHDPFPLTKVQHAYLLGRRDGFLLGGVGSHWYWEFDGERVDLARLERCWNRLVRRHEMLRAIFEQDGRQRILSAVPDQKIEVTTAAAGAAEHALNDLRESLSHRIPDPGVWPVMTIRAVRYGARTRVAFSFDYVALDALSIVTVFSELSRLYADEATQLRPIGMSFRDYVLSALPDPAERESARQYWHGRLPMLVTGPELPLCLDPASIVRPRFTRRESRLTPADWNALKKQSRNHQVTPAMVLATAYFEVLAAWSDRPEFSVTYTVFDRRDVHPDITAVVGDFTSLMLVSRPAPPALDWVSRVRAVQAQVWSGMEHQAISAIDIMREMGKLADSAVTTVPIVFTSALGLPGDVVSFDATFGRQVWGISQTPQVWLDSQVMERDGGLSFNWDAVEDLFAEGVLDAMFGAYEDLLLGLSRQDWSEYPLEVLPPDQRAVRGRVNATDGVLPRGLLHSRFFEAAGREPERDAVRWGDDGRLSYAELADQALRIAGHLVAAGVRPGDAVGVTLERGPCQVAAVLGVLAAGGAYLPLGVDQPVQRRARILMAAGVRSVLGDRADAAPPGVSLVPLQAAIHGPALPGPIGMPDNQLAYIICTSGSTGEPKGVEITHQSAVNTVTDICDRFGIGSGDAVLALSSLDFDLSVFDIFGLLGVGGAVVLLAEDDRREPSSWCRLVRRRGVTIWNSVPALLDMFLLAAEPDGAAAGLRTALVSGDWVGLDLPGRVSAQAPGCQLVALGGATEASIWSNMFPVTRVDPAWRSVPYGYPLRNQRFRVVDEMGRDRPDWVAGELWIGGSGVARGYRNDPERTAERFVRHQGTTWYRTGDLGRYRPDGTLEFLGRLDHQVKVRGHRIELGEVEACLQAHPAIVSAIVVTVGDTRPRLAAAVRVNSEIACEAVRAFLRTKLPSYMVPEFLTIVEAWPLSGNGKVDRVAVAALITERDAHGTHSGSNATGQPQGQTEAEIAALWRAVLGLDAVGRMDTFFSLGGESLAATELVGRTNRRFGVELTLRQFFDGPTVAEMATAVDDLRRDASGQLTEEGLL